VGRSCATAGSLNSGSGATGYPGKNGGVDCPDVEDSDGET
jgi:hypothetical protein